MQIYTSTHTHTKCVSLNNLYFMHFELQIFHIHTLMDDLFSTAAHRNKNTHTHHKFMCGRKKPTPKTNQLRRVKP